MTYVVFSDVGGTLFEGTPWAWLREHPSFNLSRSQVELFKFLPVLLLNKMGFVSETTMRNRWLAHMASTFTGMSRETIHKIYADVIAGAMGQALRQDIVEHLQEHKQKGATVILVSGIFADLIQKLAEHIGIDGAIGTNLEYRDDVATGRLSGNPCVGPQKIDYIKQFMQTRYPDIDLQDCYGYADSYSDRALLSIVGHSIVTYPDDEMRQVAGEHGWEIIPE
jgi:HAD superfamily hydrolase (TIGR01490 family)